jgi:hypothetical protein
VDLRDDRRRRQVEEVGIALDVVGVVAEALTAILLFRETPPMDEDAPRPVEDEDPLREKCFELWAYVLNEIGSRLRGRKPEGSRGSLGVW